MPSEAELRPQKRYGLYRRYFKRPLDFVLSLAAIIILSPFLLLIALLVRIKLGSPVIFKQIRAGYEGKPFIIYKFRSMTNKCDEKGNLLPDEKRLTKFGVFLRSTSLDELPELYNVLKGDMSLVGPRPLHVRYIERYSPEQARRLEEKPGITGWAQVNGRNALSWEDRFKLDVWYIDNMNFLLDIHILLLTLIKVLKREGISGKGHVTMEEFKGNIKEKTP